MVFCDVYLIAENLDLFNDTSVFFFRMKLYSVKESKSLA